MKNIWKLLMIALLAFAMIGCPTTKEDDDDNNGSSGGGVGGIEEAVFTFEADLNTISGAWGGSQKLPTFSIMLVDQYFIDGLKAGTFTQPQDAPATSPVYQIQAYGNLRFKTNQEGVWNVYGVDEAQDYNGVCAKVENGKYKLYVDTSKIQKTDLKGLGKKWEDSECEHVITDSDSIDLTGYMPCTIALIDTNDPAKGYVGSFSWQGEPKLINNLTKVTEAYPTNAQHVPGIKKNTIDDINDIRGAIMYDGWAEHTTGCMSGSAADSAGATYTFTAKETAANAEFKFVVADLGWDWKGGSKEGGEFGEWNEDKLTGIAEFKSDTNWKMSTVAGATYKITFKKTTEKFANVTVEKTGNPETIVATYKAGDGATGADVVDDTVIKGAYYTLAAFPNDWTAPDTKEFAYWSYGDNTADAGAQIVLTAATTNITAVYKDAE